MVKWLRQAAYWYTHHHLHQNKTKHIITFMDNNSGAIILKHSSRAPLRNRCLIHSGSSEFCNRGPSNGPLRKWKSRIGSQPSSRGNTIPSGSSSIRPPRSPSFVPVPDCSPEPAETAACADGKDGISAPRPFTTPPAGVGVGAVNPPAFPPSISSRLGATDPLPPIATCCPPPVLTDRGDFFSCR